MRPTGNIFDGLGSYIPYKKKNAYARSSCFCYLVSG